MHVIYWSDLFWPYLGGIETQAAQILPALVDKGISFTVVTSHRNQKLPDSEEWNGVSIRRFPLRKVLENRDIPALIKVKRQIGQMLMNLAPDVIHLNGIGPSALVCHALGNPGGCRFLVSLHQELSPAQRGDSRSLSAQLLQRADWVHAVSPTVLEQAQSVNPALSDRSCVIYNFVRQPALEPAPLPRDPAVLLCLGRVIPQKGFDVGLEAFASIAERFRGTRLVIAGDGEDRSMLQQRAEALGLADRVEFVGWVSPSEVPDLLNRATLLLMPSRKEGFGVVAAEAAMMARPVVGSNCGGLRDVVRHEVTGLLVDKEDAVALADALTSLLEDPGRAREMGLAGRERAIREFDLDRCTRRHEGLYRKLGSAKR